MKTRRIITMLLALLMLTTTCTSCSEKNGTEDTSDSTPTTSDTTETTTESETEPENPRLLISDDLPEADFEGRPFIILVDTEAESGYWYTDEYTSEIFLGGHNTIALHNTCEDSLLAAPLIIDLAILMEFMTRVTYSINNKEFKNFNAVMSMISYLLKAQAQFPLQF